MEPCRLGDPGAVVILGAGLSVFCADGLEVHTPMLFRSPMDRVAFPKSGVTRAILEQKSTDICSWNTVTQKPCASEALWTGHHFGNRNPGTKYRHFVFQDFFNRAGRRL